MNVQSNFTEATPENVWAILRETAQRQKEFGQWMEESIAKEERQRKKEEQRRKKEEQRRKKEEEQQRKEEEQRRKEEEQRRKEEEQQRKEEEQQRKEKERQYAEQRAATERAAERRWKRIEAEMGKWSNNQGCFAEEYFFNSFDEEQQNFFGEHFDEIEKNVKPKIKGFKDEYDIVMYNDKSVAIVEVKYKAHKNDIPKVLKKAETFRMFFPSYKDCKIYLGLASMSFYDELEQECIDQGIAVIKQVGDTVVINDTNLKVF